METFLFLFGEGKDLNTLQMSCRAAVSFFVALLLIRIAGQRTFGKGSAFDNVVHYAGSYPESCSGWRISRTAGHCSLPDHHPYTSFACMVEYIQ